MTTIKRAGITILAVLVGGLIIAGAGVTVFMQNPAPLPPATTLHCAAGNAEDSCYPDYIGNGNWVLRQGERP